MLLADRRLKGVQVSYLSGEVWVLELPLPHRLQACRRELSLHIHGSRDHLRAVEAPLLLAEVDVGRGKVFLLGGEVHPGRGPLLLLLADVGDGLVWGELGLGPRGDVPLE